MNKVYKMQFDNVFYDALCRLLTDYEYGVDDYSEEMYGMLVAVQKAMAEAMN